MSDLLKRIADYFTNCYQGDDKTAPTMEITVTDLRYIANMNVERCRAEAELRNLKYNKRKDDVCECERGSSGYVGYPAYYSKCCTTNSNGLEMQTHIIADWKYCPYCGKKIKVVE